MLLAALLLQAALLGGQHLDLLLHLRRLALLLLRLHLGAVQGFFPVGQAHGLLFDLGGQQFGLFLGIYAAGGNVFQFGLGFFLALLPE